MKKIVVLILSFLAIVMLFSCTKKKTNYRMGLLKQNKITEEELDKKLKEKASERYKNVTHCYFDDLTSAILALDRGDINGFVCNKSTCNYIKAKNPGKYKMSINEGEEETISYAMAVKKENKDLLLKMNAALDTLINNGTLLTLEAKYLNTTDIIDDIKLLHFDNKDVIKVVVTGDLPPMDYISQDGKPMGYNVALLSEISKILGTNIKLIEANAGSRSLMISSGKADVIFWVASAKSKLFDDNFESDLTDDLAITRIYNTQPVCILTK